MLTMHPVLQVGPFDWASSPVRVEDCEARLRALEGVLRAKGWRALIAYGNRSEYGDLTYLTGYAPRLADALLLVAPGQRPKILSFEGGRMVPAGRETTWLADIEPVGDLAVMLSAWLGMVGGSGAVATSSFAFMPEEHHGVLRRVAELSGAVDGSSALMALRRRKSAAELELITASAGALARVEGAIRAALKAGASARHALLKGEAAALGESAQDMRSLVSIDGGRSFMPGECLAGQPAGRLTLYVAIRRWGYWAEGFINAGETSAELALAQAMIDRVLASARPGAVLAGLAAEGEGVSIGPGNGLGASLREWPDLAAPDVRLEAGDVCSIRAVAGGEGGAMAVASAMLAVGPRECHAIWRERR